VVKTVFLLKRKPGLSPAEFREHYEEVHAPLEISLLPNIRKSVRNYITKNVMPASVEEPDFDCITEIWFNDNLESVKAVIDAANRQGDTTNQAMRHSGKVFMDTSKTVYLIVEEVESEIG